MSGAAPRVNYGDAANNQLSDLVEFAYSDRTPSFREAMYLRAARGGSASASALRC